MVFKNKKGFTLIELIAVIVIIGLLFVIAVPSVSKYMEQSKKQTLITTINNYINGVSIDINSNKYLFRDSNIIYAVPIECIVLEKGGSNPFGEWYQANNKYFAYVLVQYDEFEKSFKYGFTFKDSAGNGILPIKQNKIKENGSQIISDFDFSQPSSGIINDSDNWKESGFSINSSTKLVVLQAERDGVEGNNQTTCTLVRKGNNYESIGGIVPPIVDEDNDNFDNPTEDDNSAVCVSVSGEDLNYIYSQSVYDSTTQKYSYPGTTGTYTTGNMAISDAYRCLVGNNLSYIFNILEINGDYVTLMMNQNLDNKTVAWCNDSKRCVDESGAWTNQFGPLTAYDELVSKTKNWNNNKIINIGLPTYEQIVAAVGTTNVRSIPWLYANVRNSSDSTLPTSYWTASPSLWCKKCIMVLGYTYNWMSDWNSIYVNSNHRNGLRPTIIVRKSDIN